MQTRTQPPSARGDEDDLYRQHHHNLQRAVARRINGPRELIEDACQFAWMKLIDSQPNREATFSWLYVVALHEAYRLSTIERHDARLERLRPEDGNWDDVIADPRTVEGAHDAREALRALAALPERQRIDFALKVAGYSYEEIRARTPGRTMTNVNKSLVKARGGLRHVRA